MQYRATFPDASFGLLLLRLVTGGFLLVHGLAELFGAFGGPGIAGFASELHAFGLISFEPLPVLVASAQSIAGFLVALGLFTRTSAAIASGLLAASVALHAPQGWFWMHAGIEYPLMWTI